MRYRRMPIEIESPEELGYDNVRYNLTESSMRDRQWKDVLPDIDFPLAYGDHKGYLPLRRALASHYQNTILPDQIICTVGAASAIFIAATSILTEEDHAVILSPNYITNVEIPRLIGCDISYVNLSWEKKWSFQLGEVINSCKPTTKLISITTPHNPTGIVIPENEIQALIKFCEAEDIHLLIDETYGDMGPISRKTFATASKHVTSLASLSKTYGLPGIRMGWMITQNEELFERYLAAKEQIFVTGSYLDEVVAANFLERASQILPSIQEEIKQKRQVVEDWINSQSGFSWVIPEGGCVGFVKVNLSEGEDKNLFYKILNKELETYVGPGHWFEQDKSFFRLGFGYPTLEEIQQGLENLTKAYEQIVQRS